MGLTVTTSAGARDSEGDLDWIFDPSEIDGEAIGLCWSTSPMSLRDALAAADIIEEGQALSGLEVPIREADVKIQMALLAVGSGNDYLSLRLNAVARVIRAGLRHGATHLIAD